MTPSVPLRAAVLGASGIGRYHVRELVRAGVEVVAIQGSSEASAARTARRLEARLGVRPRALVALDEVLEQDLDLVCVATPHELHFDACVRALARGIAVFCEKPLVWRPGIGALDARAMLAELAMAGAKERLCVNTSNASFVRALHERGLLPEAPRRFRFELATRGRDRGEDIAVDLLPHALSLLRELEPRAPLQDVAGRAEEHLFEVRLRAGAVDATFRLEEHAEARKRMVFAVDDLEVERVQRDVAGEYRVFLRAGGDLHEVTDPFAAWLGAFVDALRGTGTPPVSFEASGRILLDGLRLVEAVRPRDRERSP